MSVTTTSVHDFMSYQLAQSEARAAFARYEASLAALSKARIEEREAELKSQSLKSVGKGALAESLGVISERERNIGLAFARYAVYGRTD